jgi:hypothetical protein
MSYDTIILLFIVFFAGIGFLIAHLTGMMIGGLIAFLIIQFLRYLALSF